jgi:hypothetical protein
VQGLGTGDPIPGRWVGIRVDSLGPQNLADARFVLQVEQEACPSASADAVGVDEARQDAACRKALFRRLHNPQQGTHR